MSAPTSPPTSPAPRMFSGKLISCKVLLLDDTTHSFHIPMKSHGQVLFDEVVRKLRLLESDYFDLEYTDVRGVSCWLDHDKPILRQLPQHGLSLRFIVKFYTPDPGSLEEEYTRYLFALQIKRDLVTGTMPCQEHTAILLASFIVQSEFGDFVEDEFGPDPSYAKYFGLLPHQSEDSKRRLMDHHKELIGQIPAVADYNLLDTARKVELYGIQMHSARDHEGVALQLSVAHMGVLVFQSLTKINTFSWAKIRKLSFKRKKFLVKLHPEGYGYYKDTVEFYFDSRNACKNFWKRCIEHHAFFRCQSVKRVPRNRPRVVSRGSSFRYSGRTQKQLLEYVRDSSVKRPEFHRSTSMRTMSPSYSAGATPRSGTLNSREWRSARAASAPGGSRRASRSTTCICTSVEQLRSSTLDKASKRVGGGGSRISTAASVTSGPPKQSKSLQTIQPKTAAVGDGVIDNEALRNDNEVDETATRLQSQTLPFAVDRSRAKTKTKTSTTTRDDFHHIYHFDQSAERLHDIETNNVEAVENDDEDPAVCFNGNLSQDSYRVTDSRDSSVDRLESRGRVTSHGDVDDDGYTRNAVSCVDAVDVEDGGTLPPVAQLDRDRLVMEPQVERQFRETALEKREVDGDGDHDGDEADDVADRRVSEADELLATGDETVSEVDDIKLIKAQSVTSDSTEHGQVRHTEIICIETTRVVQTVERAVTYTNMTNSTASTANSEYDRKRKRLSRESAVRIIDEDMMAVNDEAESEPVKMCDEISIGTNGLDRAEQLEKVESTGDIALDNSIEKIDGEAEDEVVQSNFTEMEQQTILLDDCNVDNSTPTTRDQTVESTTERADLGHGDTIQTQTVDDAVEVRVKQRAAIQLETLAETGDSTATSGVNGVHQSTVEDLICTRADSVLRQGDGVPAAVETPEYLGKDNSGKDVTIPISDPVGYDVTNPEESNAVGSIGVGVHRVLEADDDKFQTNQAEQCDADHSVQVVVWPVADIVAESEIGSELKEEPQQTQTVAEASPDFSDEDIPYVLHKRTVHRPVDFRNYSSLPSRSRSTSPRRGPPSATIPPLTREQKRAQMEKVKASLVSMASSPASRTTARSPGAANGCRRVFDFVQCNRLPPRDSFSSIDDSVSPPATSREPLQLSKISATHNGVTTFIDGDSTDRCTADGTESQAAPTDDDAREADTSKKSDSCSDDAWKNPSEDEVVVNDPSDSVLDSDLNSPERIADAVEQQVAAVVDRVDRSCHRSTDFSAESTSTPQEESNNVTTRENDPPVTDDFKTADVPFTSHADQLENVTGRGEEESYLKPPETPIGTTLSLECEVSETQDVSHATSSPERPADVIDDNNSESATTTMKHSAQLASVALVSNSDELRTYDVMTLESEPVADDSETSCCDELFPPPPAWISMETAVGLLVPEIIVRSASVVDLSMNTYQDGNNFDESSAPPPTRAAPLAADPVESPPELRHAVVEHTVDVLCLAERQLLNELSTESHNNTADHDGSVTSSHSLNDELDADAVQLSSSATGAPPTAVDAACRLSESSVDGAVAAIGRRGHVMEWLEQQAQIMLQDSSATGSSSVIVISDDEDDDDLERPVFDGDLNDVVAALEAEAVAYPFHVGQLSNNYAAAHDEMMNDEKIQRQETSCRSTSSQPDSAVATFGTKQSPVADEPVVCNMAPIVAPPAESDSVDKDNNSTMSISSEGDVEPVIVEDLPDPLEVLEMEASPRHSPPNMTTESSTADDSATTTSVWQQAIVESSSSESGSRHELKEVDPLDVGDILDSAAAAVKECDRLSDEVDDKLCAEVDQLEEAGGSFFSDANGKSNNELTSNVRPRLTLSNSTSSSESSTAPVYTEEPDAFAALDEEENATPRKRRSGDDDDEEDDEVCGDADSDSSQSIVSASTLDTFVHQVMRYRNIDLATGNVGVGCHVDGSAGVELTTSPSDVVDVRGAVTVNDDVETDADELVWRYNDVAEAPREQRYFATEDFSIIESSFDGDAEPRQQQLIDADVVERCAEQFIKKLVEDCCVRSSLPAEYYADQVATATTPSIAAAHSQTVVGDVDPMDQSRCQADDLDDELSSLATECLECAAIDSSPNFDEQRTTFGDAATFRRTDTTATNMSVNVPETMPRHRSLRTDDEVVVRTRSVEHVAVDIMQEDVTISRGNENHDSQQQQQQQQL